MICFDGGVPGCSPKSSNCRNSVNLNPFTKLHKTKSAEVAGTGRMRTVSRAGSHCSAAPAAAAPAPAALDTDKGRTILVTVTVFLLDMTWWAAAFLFHTFNLGV